MKTKMATEETSPLTGEMRGEGSKGSPAINNPLNIADCKTKNKGTLDKTDRELLAKQMKINRRGQKKRRKERIKAKRKEMRLAEKRTEAENQIGAMISSVQVDIQNVVEAEKRKSEQYLSLARKYYKMWKTLNDERSQQRHASKIENPEEKDIHGGVSLLKEQNFMFPLAMTSVTMNKRFSDNASSSDPFKFNFKIPGETLNISSII